MISGRDELVLLRPTSELRGEYIKFCPYEEKSGGRLTSDDGVVARGLGSALLLQWFPLIEGRAVIEGNIGDGPIGSQGAGHPLNP